MFRLFWCQGSHSNLNFVIERVCTFKSNCIIYFLHHSSLEVQEVTFCNSSQTVCPHWQRCERVILVIAAIPAIFAGNDSVGHRNIKRLRLLAAMQCNMTSTDCKSLRGRCSVQSSRFNSNCSRNFQTQLTFSRTTAIELLVHFNLHQNR